MGESEPRCDEHVGELYPPRCEACEQAQQAVGVAPKRVRRRGARKRRGGGVRDVDQAV
jgi:hypothetical protein